MMKNLYFESSVMILTLISLGKYLEAKAKKKTGDAISKLLVCGYLSFSLYNSFISNVL